MDFPIYLPTTKVFVQIFFFGKSLAGGYPTYLQFGHMFKIGLPYLPSILVWTKISLDKMMTLNNENPFQTTAKTSSSSSYLEITVLLYKYGHTYLPTFHKIFCPKIFFGKSMAGGYPTYLQFGHMSEIS